MNNYHNFVLALQKQLTKMAKTGLFEVNLDKDSVWDTYLASFPEGTNLIYKERREYDCNCCKQFIRDVGRVVTFVNGKKVSIWDIQVEGYYAPVVQALADLVKSAPVENTFLHYTNKVGTQQSNVLNGDNTVTVFHHFNAVLPSTYVKPNAQIATILNDVRGNIQVLKRSLEEFTTDAAETVLELNSQGSLYRGNEQVAAVTKFLELKKKYDQLQDKEAFLWTTGVALGAFGKFRNTAIGTLLEDLSGGMDIESAVKRWEKVMAPANYKRPTALVTEAMIRKAQDKVQELGLMDALPRRYAVESDITINNVLFADRSARKAMNAFDDLAISAKKPTKGPSGVEEISVADFVSKVLPKAEGLEVFVENRMAPNFVSLIAPVYADAGNMLKWDNNFSWSYNGEVTDSIKDRVKAAGGRVDGALRVSLSWFNSDDLDLHMKGPNGKHTYYSNRQNNGAYLDLDMNGMDKHDEFSPVENIIWTKEDKIEEGTYLIYVNQFNKRMRDREGFVVEMEYKGQLFTFNYDKAHGSGNINVLKFKYSREKGVEIIESIGHTAQSKEFWGVKTQAFVPVSLVMNSPNHWDDNATGNKHLFFMLKGAKNPGDTRGFYNEYLRNELNEHKKVFEQLAGKMKAKYTDDQLSGIGFSDTKRDELLVKVTGQFTRTLKVKF